MAQIADKMAQIAQIADKRDEFPGKPARINGKYDTYR